ncbi:Hypothetical protein FKW44_010311 [Caligus rogercresseyi]|uniref:Uncharacterized protein n=1 Tax=Caligus rogercresseyi TaxID=217165 RepID=A0A7T8K794_CALRO|nr:Hypothetical protein FKW44_010311 [Caligus rogercresseyi]
MNSWQGDEEDDEEIMPEVIKGSEMSTSVIEESNETDETQSLLLRMWILFHPMIPTLKETH